VTTQTPAVLTGERTRLRPRVEEDLPLFVRWYSDAEVRHWLHMSETPPATEQSERNRWERYREDAARIGWVIETLDGTPIGNIALVDIDWLHGRCELGVSIGEKSHWGRGYGTDAIRCVLRHAFETVHLRRVELITDVDNARGIRCYEKAGFVREGVLRQHRLRYGEPLDMVLMAALAGEWR